MTTRIVSWLRTLEEYGIPANRTQVSKLIGSDGRRLARVVAEAAGQVIDFERAEELDRRAGDIYSNLNTDLWGAQSPSRSKSNLSTGR